MTLLSTLFGVSSPEVHASPHPRSSRKPEGQEIKLIVIDNFSGIAALAAALAKLSDRFEVVVIYTLEVDLNAISVAQKQIPILLLGTRS